MFFSIERTRDWKFTVSTTDRPYMATTVCLSSRAEFLVLAEKSMGTGGGGLGGGGCLASFDDQVPLSRPRTSSEI